MLQKAHEYRLGTKSLSRIRSSSSLSSLPLRVGLCDYLLEPRQEVLINLKESSDLHPLIVNFFEATFVACNICDLVLSSVNQARANYSRIQRAIKLASCTGLYVSKTLIPISQDLPSQTIVPADLPRRKEFNCEVRESPACTDYVITDAQCRTLLDELASFAMLNNPLLSISPSQFGNIHDNHGYLLQKLTMKCRKVKMRAKFTRCCKQTLGLGLNTSSVERLGAQLEVAKKGIHVLIYNFDTMSRLVKRLEDEIEHIKVVSDVCVRNGKMEVVKKAVGELGNDQKGFLEQLDELEEQIYLCFLNINRSRRHVMEEIMGLQQENRGKSFLCC
ncbi:hypothetical protein Vadar_000356 [Vaccinium darrowii]|uniref:Uncharacterized protein n=1 Tax=Vaccinium darrowii TaxID=229202 RepID=A0ACB7XVM2_9ERIC|nr:hypothetical protein Vadar_000356 [Vaccinium darrowii]